jgi:TPR repeat protein
MAYCSMHLVDYDLGTMCPECRREQNHQDQQQLIELQRESLREAERQRDALLSAVRDGEYKRFNPGNYQCDACKLMTLLAGASRCPVCRADVGPQYWPSVRIREEKARAAVAAAAKAAEDARKRACDSAVTTVTLGIRHTQELFDEAFQEATMKHAAQGRFSRLLAPLPLPSRQHIVRLEHTGGARCLNGRWITQPALIFGIVTRESQLRIGFKHFRFATPHEYIAALGYIKTIYPELSEIDRMIAVYKAVLYQDWPTGDAGRAKRVDASQEEAWRRYREDAPAGDAASQYELARMHANGHGVPQDYAEALKWYCKAADQGHAGAQRNIGVMYVHGQAVAQDYAEGLQWYRKAADQGDAQAQRNIGVMYVHGQGVVQDYAEGLQWYRKAADQGDAQAQRNIGWMHTHGKAVAQDYVKALKWYRKAADQGHAQAQRDIGWMYVHGYGVTQDFAEGRKWYRKAADQEDPRFYADLISGKFDK